MPRKTSTWVGLIIVLAAGGFCFWALARYRNDYGVIDTTFRLLTASLFLVPAVAIGAIAFWYYFNERR